MDNLEYHDFADEEATSFKAVMRQHAEQLDDEVYAELHCENTSLFFLKASILCSTLYLHDQWNRRMEARYITLAVANSQVPRMPWEVLLWGSETIADILTEVKVPEKLLEHVRNVHEAALDAFGTGWCSLATVKTTVENKS